MGADLNCREAARLLSLGCDRPLTAEESSALEYHLAKCRLCRGFGEQIRFLGTVASRFRIGSA